MKSSIEIDPPAHDNPPTGQRGTVEVRLGGLAAEALSASGRPAPERLERTLAQAIRYYLIEGEKQPPGWAFPTFLSAGTPESSLQFEIPVERAGWERLGKEAERQGVSPQALLQHAALYFAAARDAGRLTDQLLDVLRDGDA